MFCCIEFVLLYIRLLNKSLELLAKNLILIAVNDRVESGQRSNV